MKNSISRAILFGSAALCSGTAIPAFAQDSDPADVIVTAQRVEERLQDVPISITVFNQKQIDNTNIVSAKDLAAYTPSLSVNVRNGDVATFAIRGFTQDGRQLATVGTYFADVVAPRGGVIQPGGDAAGPGSFFDLQNVQVLKGPQGTLFGRNTTGGAVLLVPKKPTSNFEGYVEGSVGAYDMRRVQAVVNVPLADTFRVRLGVDRMTRDGYLHNVSNLGPKDMGDQNYWSFRLGISADLTPNLENYFVGYYQKSRTNGIIAALGGCNPAATLGAFQIGAAACAQIARLQGRSFWTVENSQENPHSNSDVWQLIDTTTWRASDTLTVKNIISYGQYWNDKIEDLYGAYWPIGGLSASQVTNQGQVTTFVPSRRQPGKNLNDQYTFTEELHVEGSALADALTYQAGVYFEYSAPLSSSGVQNTSFPTCVNPDAFQCAPGTTGIPTSIALQTFNNSFNGKAVFAQASYNITEQLKLTLGGRYTWDKMSSDFQNISVNFFNPATATLKNLQSLNAFGTNYRASCVNPSANPDPSPAFYGTDVRFFSTLAAACQQSISKKSKAPTWLINLDYKPIEEIMLYAKYARGYRSGGVSPAAGDGAFFYDPERVDLYEAGLKAAWRGSMPGTFNISAFYNNFSDQQLTIQLTSLPTNIPTATISLFNVGKSVIKGFEMDGQIQPFEYFRIMGSYSYLKSKVKSVDTVTAPFPYNTALNVPVAGSPIVFTIPHKVTVGAEVMLPHDDASGRVTAGVNFTYQSSFPAFLTRHGDIPGYSLWNAHVNWENVAGSPIDASLFVTNLTNKKYYTHVNDQDNFTVAPAQGSRGFWSYYLGEPRMWGVRLKYKFGE